MQDKQLAITRGSHVWHVTIVHFWWGALQDVFCDIDNHKTHWQIQVTHSEGLRPPLLPSRLPKASWNVCEEMPPSLPIPTCIRSDVLLRLTKSRLWICLCWDHVLQLTVE